NTVINNESQFYLGNLAVNPEVFYSVVDTSLFTIMVSVQNQARSCVTIRMTGQEFENSGKVALNSLSMNTTSDCNITVSESFLNTGNIFFGISAGEYVALKFSITSATSWYNSGKFIFFVAHGEIVNLQIYCHAGPRDFNSIRNDGVVCLNNTTWQVNTNVDGNGCVALGSGGQLYL
ncbi:hypothetical protein METBIDRAFT_18603, partial [Metschnikowia bicuspidata var. bicuspidata NRRL YB-4993]